MSDTMCLLTLSALIILCYNFEPLNWSPPQIHFPSQFQSIQSPIALVSRQVTN